MKTKLFKLAGSLWMVGLMLAVTSAALANVPNDAGWKARGMHNATGTRAMRYYAAPATPAPAGRQAFSYEPSPTPAPAAVAPAPQTGAGYRTYTYQPQPVRAYSRATRRGYSYDANHFGGSYPSKATLYNH